MNDLQYKRKTKRNYKASKTIEALLADAIVKVKTATVDTTGAGNSGSQRHQASLTIYRKTYLKKQKNITFNFGRFNHNKLIS